MPDSGYEFAKEFQLLYAAQQKPAPSSCDDSMTAQLQSYPPLGQVTPLREDEVVFTAILDAPQVPSNGSWETSLWHSVDGRDWTDLPLEPVEDVRAPRSLDLSVPETTSRFYFSSKLIFEKCVQFTLKFRHSSSGEWRWIRDEYGLDDGTIVKSLGGVASDRLSDLIPDLNARWKVSSCISQSPGTQVWALEAPIPPADGDDSTYKDLTIGTPWGSYLR